MKVLFLHPEDQPERGPWARERWDCVVDLGMAGPAAYERWRDFFHCPAMSAGFAMLPPEAVREAIAAGLDIVRDQRGIDWWEILCDGFTQHLYEVLALRGLASVSAGDELFVSRECFHARALGILSNRPVRVFPGRSGLVARFRGLHRKLRRLSLIKIRQIIADKSDPKHNIRATVAGKVSASGSSVVLLPTAYVNVSRTALAYARDLPESQFLLVAARRSGWRSNLPPNVAQVDLAAYFRPTRHAPDHEELVSQLPRLKRRLQQNELFGVITALHMFDGLENDLRRWLVVRDAWVNVFDSEPVTSVLCCDGTNPYTLIPLLVAKQRGVTAILAHHGALDGHYLVKRNSADYVLAKGEMEHEYLVRRCGIPCEQVVIGAPTLPPRATRGTQSHIVLFSEDYEVSGARVDELYRSVLPGLAKLAAENGKELILKLHPAENIRDRRRIARSVLPAEQFRRLRIVDGPLTEDLMAHAWFALAGISTTAVDCAVRGVPVFLCAWLENWPYGYIDQFAKFGVGVKLGAPDEVQQIPAMLCRFELCNPIALWNPITPERLDDVLYGSVRADMAAAI